MTVNQDTINFRDYINSDFELVVNSQESLVIRLIEIEEKKTKYTISRSLLFRGSGDKCVSHNSHLLKHPDLGEFSLFIGPVIYPKQDGIYYEAIRNSLVCDGK